MDHLDDRLNEESHATQAAQHHEPIASPSASARCSIPQLTRHCTSYGLPARQLELDGLDVCQSLLDNSQA